MEEISKLNMDKYLVVKRDDLDKYFSQFTAGVFTTETEAAYIDSIPFNLVLEEIQSMRASEGKKDNKYLVLNVDDEIDIVYLESFLHHSPKTVVRVSDIATALVNAILKTKKDT